VCYGDVVLLYDFKNHGFITSEGCRHPISREERENREQNSEQRERGESRRQQRE
jgi:hypothetical protein